MRIRRSQLADGHPERRRASFANRRVAPGADQFSRKGEVGDAIGHVTRQSSQPRDTTGAQPSPEEV